MNPSKILLRSKNHLNVGTILNYVTHFSKIMLRFDYCFHEFSLQPYSLLFPIFGSLQVNPHFSQNTRNIKVLRIPAHFYSCQRNFELNDYVLRKDVYCSCAGSSGLDSPRFQAMESSTNTFRYRESFTNIFSYRESSTNTFRYS